MATSLDVLKLLGANQDSASNMVVVKGVKWRDAHVVLKGKLDYAYLMGEVVGASFKGVIKEHKEALCIVKLMVVENVVFSPVVLKVLKVVLRYVKPTVAGKDVFMMEVGFVLKASTVGQTFALLMVAGKGVLLLVVLRVHVGGPIAA